jgi:hypothetical protein
VTVRDRRCQGARGGCRQSWSTLIRFRARSFRIEAVCGSGPTTSAPDGCSCSAKLSGQGSLVHPELARYDRERRALLVSCGCERGRFVGHLPDDAAAPDARLVEVVDDAGPVDFVETGKPVNRRAFLVEVDQLVDLGLGKPSLHRV